MAMAVFTKDLYCRENKLIWPDAKTINKNGALLEIYHSNMYTSEQLPHTTTTIQILLGWDCSTNLFCYFPDFYTFVSLLVTYWIPHTYLTGDSRKIWKSFTGHALMQSKQTLNWELNDRSFNNHHWTVHKHCGSFLSPGLLALTDFATLSSSLRYGQVGLITSTNDKWLGDVMTQSCPNFNMVLLNMVLLKHRRSYRMDEYYTYRQNKYIKMDTHLNRPDETSVEWRIYALGN